MLMCLPASPSDLAWGTGPTELMQMLCFDYRTLYAAFFPAHPFPDPGSAGGCCSIVGESYLMPYFFPFFFSFPGKYRIVCVTPLHSRYLLCKYCEHAVISELSGQSDLALLRTVRHSALVV